MKLLIVVDYQKDFVDGSLGFPGAEKYDEIISEKIRAYRENGDQIIFTYDTHYEDYMNTQEGRKLPVPHCMDESEGWQLYGETGKLKEEGDLVFKKVTFGSMELAEYLKGRDYESIELCGLVSNICVLSNAVLCKAALPEVEIIVDAAATGSMSEEMDEKTFDVLEGIQIEVKGRK